MTTDATVTDTTDAIKLDLTVPVAPVPAMPALTGKYKDDTYLKGLRAAVSAKGNRWQRSDECVGLATHCACCGKALKDPLSVQLVIGPDCRKMYGNGQNVPDAPDWIAAKTLALNYGVEEDAVKDWSDAREVCRLLLHIYALAAEANPWVPNAVDALGYRGLAKRMEARRDAFVKRAAKRAADEAKVAAERARIAKMRGRYVGASYTGASAPVATPATATPATMAVSPTDPPKVTIGKRTDRWIWHGKEYTKEVLVVASPKHDGFIAAVRSLPGRHWDGASKVWTLPKDQRPALWNALRTHFAGATLVTDQGESTIPAMDADHN